MTATLTITRKNGAVQTLEAETGLKIEIKSGDVIRLSGASVTGGQLSGDDFIISLSDGARVNLANFIGLVVGDSPPRIVNPNGSEIASLEQALNIVASTAGDNTPEDDIRATPIEYGSDPFIVDPPPQGPLKQDFPFDLFPTLEPAPGLREPDGPADPRVNHGPSAIDDFNMVQAGMPGQATDQDPMVPDPVVGNVIDGLGNPNSAAPDSDVDNDPLNVVFVEDAGQTDREGNMVDPIAAGTMVTGLYGTLTLNPDGSYTYDLDDGNADVLGLQLGQSLQDVFVYKISDGDNTDTATLTITVKGNNDGPTAMADTNAVTAGMHNDDPGMDPAAVTGNVIGGGGAGDVADTDPDLPDDTLLVTDVDGTAVDDGANPSGTAIQGAYGVLTVFEDGSYSYDLDDGSAAVLGLAAGEVVEDVFTYTIGDTGGKTSSSTLTVEVTGNNDGPMAMADTNAIQEADGDTNGVNVTTGNVLEDQNHDLLGMQFGDNADSDPDLPDDTLMVTMAGTNSADTAVGGPTTIVGQYGTLTINPDGTYSYDLDDSNPIVDALVDENDMLVDSFTYEVEDAGGKSDTTTLDITIKGFDDNGLPTAHDDCFDVQEQGTQTVKALFILDRSSSMAVDNRLELAKDAILEFASQPGVDSIRVLPFDGNADTPSAWFDLTEPGGFVALQAFLEPLTTGRGTNYKDAIADAQGLWGGAADEDVNNVYFISDGAASGNNFNDNDVAAWETFLVDNNIDNSFAIGIDAGPADADLQKVGWPNSAPDGNVIQIDSADDLNGTFNSTLSSNQSGNVLADNGAGADDFGPDGPDATMAIMSIQIGAVT